ncbi:ATP-binding cassette domain-containing protein [Candidatus Dependentiae bacterium]|nr:ATP-binding cassette domain-containing protein [Candidatus Dependentiae bacterium]MBU4387665.1 ATP-binding cassette domain-containing protein [Candidatus Dependentiae bacterium]MCG2756052.1 ATP-binding cassette domain-containing protein [Candidatus Dependentiae bacterium]
MIEIKNLTKSFGDKKITRGLDLTIKNNDFLAIIGRSGEGKSVLLKQIIGLIKPDAGEIIIDGQNISKLTKIELQEVYKKCGYVFQFAALLDSLNVFENIGITLLENDYSQDQVLPEVIRRLKSVGLGEDVLYKYPAELSGGMKKRVGLARTLMLSPQILIYDEPTTGLDPITVKLIHELIKKTHEDLNATTIVISHDIEIFKYAKTVAMLHEGKIIYTGPTENIWDCQNPYIYQFIRGLEEGPITKVY